MISSEPCNLTVYEMDYVTHCHSDSSHKDDDCFIVCLIEYILVFIMDNTNKQRFDVLERLFIRVASIKRKYQDDTDCKACIQCYLRSGLTAIF